MTPEELSKKVLFTRREVPSSELIEIVGAASFKVAKYIDKAALQTMVENEKEVMNRIKRDIVRLLFHSIYVQHREEFYRYLLELRYNMDDYPNSKVDQILKQMAALFD